jgi:hypothetical protein
MAHNALKKSRASLKHIIVFSDGDPAAPRPQTMADIVADKITLSTVLISGHAGPETMVRMAEDGQGRFYDVKSPEDLPQIFIKEAAVILKTAIYEDPFTPQVRSPGDELTRGLGPAAGYPELLGYVATSAKPRAETPLWTTQGDPLLAHWQYGPRPRRRLHLRRPCQMGPQLARLGPSTGSSGPVSPAGACAASRTPTFSPKSPPTAAAAWLPSKLWMRKATIAIS